MSKIDDLIARVHATEGKPAVDVAIRGLLAELMNSQMHSPSEVGVMIGEGLRKANTLVAAVFADPDKPVAVEVKGAATDDEIKAAKAAMLAEKERATAEKEAADKAAADKLAADKKAAQPDQVAVQG